MVGGGGQRGRADRAVHVRTPRVYVQAIDRPRCIHPSYSPNGHNRPTITQAAQDGALAGAQPVPQDAHAGHLRRGAGGGRARHRRAHPEQQRGQRAPQRHRRRERHRHALVATAAPVGARPAAAHAVAGVHRVCALGGGRGGGAALPGGVGEDRVRACYVWRMSWLMGLVHWFDKALTRPTPLDHHPIPCQVHEPDSAQHLRAGPGALRGGLRLALLRL